MIVKEDDELSAFPWVCDDLRIVAKGMTLRDYFAAKALQGLIAGCYAGNNSGFTVDGNVFAAYEYADAMMKAREQ